MIKIIILTDNPDNIGVAKSRIVEYLGFRLILENQNIPALSVRELSEADIKVVSEMCTPISENTSVYFIKSDSASLLDKNYYLCEEEGGQNE